MKAIVDKLSGMLNIYDGHFSLIQWVLYTKANPTSYMYLLIAIQHTACTNVSNILGDNRQPNASLVRT